MVVVEDAPLAPYAIEINLINFNFKSEEIKKLQKENSNLTENKEKWFQAYNVNKATINKLENQISSLNTKCQSKESETVSFRKEIEQIKRGLKNSTLNINENEIKLNRALEEVEKLKNNLKIAKQEEKELKDTHKRELTELTRVIKKLQKQKDDLLSGFKKQIQLVDNLKKQKAYLEVLKLNQIAENEFMKILDWKIKT